VLQIRDPVLFLPLDPGSGSGIPLGKNPDPGSEIRDKCLGPYFRDLSNTKSFGLKIIDFFFNPKSMLRIRIRERIIQIRDPGWTIQIRDPGWTIQIRDGQSRSRMDNPDPGWTIQIQDGQSRSGMDNPDPGSEIDNPCGGELVLDPGPDLEGGGVRGSGQPEQFRPPASLVQINLPNSTMVRKNWHGKKFVNVMDQKL
jgi:hypothetical protein